MINIPKEELEKYEDYVIYNEGYRIVYYYEKYHEAAEGLHTKNVQDFANYLNVSTNISVNEILTEFLNCKTNALGVAIFNVNGKCVAQKIKDNVKKINNSEVYKEELIYDYAFVRYAIAALIFTMVIVFAYYVADKIEQRNLNLINQKLSEKNKGNIE